MANERFWESVPTKLFISNGGSEGQVQLLSTKNIKVKQKVFVKSNTQPQIQLEVKKVLNSTDIVLGPPGHLMRGVGSYTDLTSYLQSDSAQVRIDEQKRPDIFLNELNRYIYEEEPAMAIRSFLVDYLGNAWDENNPLPVEGTITTSPDDPNVINIQNIPIADETQEYMIAIPNYTKRFVLRIRNHETTARLASNSGETDTKYWSLSRGTIFDSSKVNLNTSSSVYIKVQKPNVVVEVLSWTLI